MKRRAIIAVAFVSACFPVEHLIGQTALITGKVVEGVSEVECKGLTMSTAEMSQHPGRGGIHVSYWALQFPEKKDEVVSEPNGRFTTRPVVVGNYQVRVRPDLHPQFAQFVPKGFSGSFYAAMDIRREAEPAPICLYPPPPPDNAHRMPDRPAGPGRRSAANIGTGLIVSAAYGMWQQSPAKMPEREPAWNHKDIRGRVTVPPGSKAEPAKVQIRRRTKDNDDFVVVSSKTTNADGSFSFSLDATSDQYLISFTRDGFRPTNILLTDDLTKDLTDSDGQLAIDVALEKESLETPTPVAVIRDLRVNLDEAAHRSVFLPVELLGLPIRGTRSLDSFALLAPGILPAPATSGMVGPGISPGVGSAGQFSANGLRARENNFIVDGSDNNDEEFGARRQGFVHLMPLALESTQEFQLISVLADARYGREIGAQVNALSSSGTREFHLTAYTYLTDQHLRARNFFDRAPGTGRDSFALTASDGRTVFQDGRPLQISNPVLSQPPFGREQAGFVAGGPLGPAKASSRFFLVSYEFQGRREEKQSHFAVPTLKQRGFSGSGETGLRLGQPAYPSSKAGDAIFSLFPFPNSSGGPYGVNTYTEVLNADASGHLASIKFDQRFHLLRDHAFNVRYSFADGSSTLPETGSALYSSMRAKDRTQNVAAFLTTNLSESWSNVARFSYGLTNSHFVEVRDPSLVPSVQFQQSVPFLLNKPLLLNVSLPDGGPNLMTTGNTTEEYTGPVGEVRLAGFSPVGVDTFRFPQERGNSTFQWADTASWAPLWNQRRHNFTLGMEVWSIRLDSTVDRNARPRIDFFGRRVDFGQFEGVTDSGRPLLLATDLVAAGIPSAFYHTLATAKLAPVELHRKQLDLFVQDEFRIAPNFKLIAGFRLEANREPGDDTDQLRRDFDSGTFNPELDTFRGQCRSLNKSEGYCDSVARYLGQAFPPGFNKVFGADPLGKDLRIGFAWDPWKSGTTVIRGGWGNYKGQFPVVLLNESRSFFPRFLPLNYATPTTRGGYFVNLAQPTFSGVDFRGLSIVKHGTLNLLNPDFTNDSIFALAGALLGQLSPVLDPVQPATGLHNPYSHQYALRVEHEFRRNYVAAIAYVGTIGRKLLRVAPADPTHAPELTISKVAPSDNFPLFTSTLAPRSIFADNGLLRPGAVISRTLFESSASSSFNSLQAEFRGRDSGRGLEFGTAFTYSHAIDDASDFFDTAGAFALPQDSLGPAERGDAGFDARFRLVAHFFWEPWRQRGGAGKGGAGHEKLALPGFGSFLRGWQLSGICTAQSGQPFTVNSAIDVNQDGNLTDRLASAVLLDFGPFPGLPQTQLRIKPQYAKVPEDLLSPTERATLVCSKASQGASGPLTNVCDGALGRNTFRAAGILNLDFALSRGFFLKTGQLLLFRAEAFNLFNRPQFAIPVRILEAPAFGSAVSTAAPNRTVQFVLKYSF